MEGCSQNLTFLPKMAEQYKENLWDVVGQPDDYINGSLPAQTTWAKGMKEMDLTAQTQSSHSFFQAHVSKNKERISV